MICGNTSDFIGQPCLNILYPHMGPPTKPGPQDPPPSKPGAAKTTNSWKEKLKLVEKKQRWE